MLRIFDYLRTHATLRWLTLCCFTAVLAASVMRLTYKEDISDFLPLGTADRDNLNIYKEISGADKLFIISTTMVTLTAQWRRWMTSCREVSRVTPQDGRPFHDGTGSTWRNSPRCNVSCIRTFPTS